MAHFDREPRVVVRCERREGEIDEKGQAERERKGGREGASATSVTRGEGTGREGESSRFVRESRSMNLSFSALVVVA